MKDADVLNLEASPSAMPKHVTTWLEKAKRDLQEHFDSRHRNIPVYDRAVRCSPQS